MIDRIIDLKCRESHFFIVMMYWKQIRRKEVGFRHDFCLYSDLDEKFSTGQFVALVSIIIKIDIADYGEKSLMSFSFDLWSVSD
jgi:hypothetical protein